MTLVAALARPGNWVDTDEPMTDSALLAVAAAGYEGIYRYVPLPNNSTALDIHADEIERTCATRRPDGSTLQCGLIQHPRAPANNNLTLHPATLDAQAGAGWARSAGYPAGAHVGLDFEGLKGARGELAGFNTRLTAIGWATQWQSIIIVGFGFRAQMYLGYDLPIDGVDAFSLHGFDSYWHGGGGPEVATRSCALRQGGEIVLGGVKFDRNVMAPDKLGGLPYVAQAA